MSTGLTDTIQSFQDYIEEWKYCYSHIVISYIAAVKDDVSKVIFGRVWFSTTMHLNKFPSFKYFTPHLQAQRTVVPLQSLQRDVLEVASEGKISLGPKNNIDVAISNRNPISMYFSKYESLDPVTGFECRTIFLNGIAGHELYGGLVDSVTLIKELKTSEEPFDGLDDLAAYLGLYDLIKQNRCGVEYSALAPGKITDETKMEAGSLTVVCEVGTDLHIGNLKITYIAYKRDGTPKRSYITADTIQWHPSEKGIQRGTAKVAVPNAIRIKLFLCYGPGLLHEKEIVDSVVNANPLAAIFETYDTGFKLLEECYSGKIKNDALFEKSIAYALSFHGFYAIHLGNHNVLNNAPDVIAVSPKGNVLLVECTLRDIDNNNKLSKLRLRYNEVKEALIKRGLGHLEVLPMVVTPISRNGVTSDLPKAMDAGIAVVCADELSGLIEGFGFTKDADEIFELFRRYIPQRQGVLGQLVEP